MSTKDSIIALGDELIRGQGFNAFSFSDISERLGIKNASVHYHFPSKTSLGVAVVQRQVVELEKIIEAVSGKNPLVQLKAFLGIYDRARQGNRICVVGALASDLGAVDEAIAKELKILVNRIIGWLTEILEEGRAKKIFRFRSAPRTRALMLAGTMLASVQLSRVTGSKDFAAIREGVMEELKY